MWVGTLSVIAGGRDFKWPLKCRSLFFLSLLSRFLLQSYAFACIKVTVFIAFSVNVFRTVIIYYVLNGTLVERVPIKDTCFCTEK